jgi:WD40 repeat protein
MRCACVVLSTGAVVTGGLKLHLYLPISAWRGETPPAAALWNPSAANIIVVQDQTLRIYDARGRLLTMLPDAIRGTATNALLDSRGRKLMISTAMGQVGVLNAKTGVAMKQLDQPHKGEVTCMKYMPDCRVLVTAGADKDVRLHDESPQHTLSLIRRIRGAHAVEITALAADRHLGLLASGAADGTVRVWDWESLRLEGECRGHTFEVTACEFATPDPVLVTCDAAGMIIVWGVRSAPTFL